MQIQILDAQRRRQSENIDLVRCDRVAEHESQPPSQRCCDCVRFLVCDVQELASAKRGSKRTATDEK